eukprot:3785874-Amphidinium_carterae.1
MNPAGAALPDEPDLCLVGKRSVEDRWSEMCKSRTSLGVLSLSLNPACVGVCLAVDMTCSGISCSMLACLRYLTLLVWNSQCCKSMTSGRHPPEAICVRVQHSLLNSLVSGAKHEGQCPT